MVDEYNSIRKSRWHGHSIIIIDFITEAEFRVNPKTIINLVLYFEK